MDYEIWSEGYQSSPDRGDATFIGVASGDSFDEAVQAYKDAHPDEAHYMVRHPFGWTYWACRLYDNEAQARITYG